MVQGCVVTFLDGCFFSKGEKGVRKGYGLGFFLGEMDGELGDLIVLFY